jgi:hypothetical protein
MKIANRFEEGEDEDERVEGDDEAEEYPGPGQPAVTDAEALVW